MNFLYQFLGELKHQVKSNALIIGLSILFFLVSVIVNLRFDMPIGSSFKPYFFQIFSLVVPIVLVLSPTLHLIRFIFVSRPQNPTRELIQIYKTQLSNPRRWAKAIPTIMFMFLAFNAFTDLKGLIPLIVEYQWDEQFMKLDRSLHFGHDPWRLLQPIFGNHITTQSLNFFYNFWFVVMFLFWVGAAWAARDYGWERQFLVSFLLSWMFGGILLALVFSSMGPAFYDLVNPINNPYVDQMAGLYAMNETWDLWALGAQEGLRDAYLDPDPAKVSGISAMPSMHNATSTLFMLAAFRINKKLGWMMAAFLGVIVISSVHLAWHYAVDAYAGIALAVILWWTAGKLVAAQDRWLGINPT